jgi:hypothetical protein
MLPAGLNLPALREPYETALRLCLEHVFESYEVTGLLASGTVVRGGGDARSDLDIQVLHANDFRERVQLWFNGVPCEIFVNPAYRVPAYFDEDVEDRRPVAPHMFATGVIVYDPIGQISELVENAKAILAAPPGPPSDFSSVLMRYSTATEFEDVDDLAERDPGAAALHLGAAVRKLAECRVYLEPGWRPRAKDLMDRLQELDPACAELARRATSDIPFPDRLAAARELCVKVTGYPGFFEWSSPRETLTKPDA